MSQVRRNRQRGSTIVETACIFLVLACLLLGMFDFGQLIFVHQALVERARLSARWGAVNGATNDQVRNKVLYNRGDTPSDGTSGYFGMTSSNVIITNTGTGTDAHKLTVQIINYPYRMLSPYIARSFTGPEIRVSVPLGMFN